MLEARILICSAVAVNVLLVDEVGGKREFWFWVGFLDSVMW